MYDKLKQVRPRHAVLGSFASLASYQLYANPELLSKLMGEAASNQIIQAGFFFTVAAWLHSGQVRRSVDTNFKSLTDSINNVAESLRNDLQALAEGLKGHSEILKNHSEELVKLTGQVQNVENNLNTLKEKK